MLKFGFELCLGFLNSLLHKDAKQKVASPHGSSALRSKTPFSFYSYPNAEMAFYFTPPQVFITFLKGSLEILPPISTSQCFDIFL